MLTTVLTTALPCMGYFAFTHGLGQGYFWTQLVPALPDSDFNACLFSFYKERDMF